MLWLEPLCQLKWHIVLYIVLPPIQAISANHIDNAIVNEKVKCADNVNILGRRPIMLLKRINKNNLIIN